MPLPRSNILPLLTCVLFAACGGDGPTGPGGNGGDNRTVKASPSFATDIQEIFVRKGCASGSCHGSGAGDLRLSSSSAATSFSNLVNVNASAEPSFKRVAPNDATNSYLVIKLEGRQSVGSRMPLSGSPLDNIDLTNIKNWVNTGAPNN